MPPARNSAAHMRRISAIVEAPAGGAAAVGIFSAAGFKRSLERLLSGILRRKLRRLVFGDQRIDDFTERFAFQDLRQLVEREVYAVFGDATLRIVVSADALGPVTGADLAAPFGSARGILLLAFQVVEPRPQHRKRLGAIAML